MPDGAATTPIDLVRAETADALGQRPLRGAELTVVVPTFNERDNVAILVARLERALRGLSWQLIFVDDDSPDGTAEVAKTIAAADGRVHCIRRLKRRGLAGVVAEGVLASAAPFIAVMDGDLQHDEALLPRMLDALRADAADVVIGSRFLDGGTSAAGVLGGWRNAGSRVANWLGRRALPFHLTDPVSGFFMLRRALFDDAAPKLSSNGFKILFDILANQDGGVRCIELPYSFRARESGSSKLDSGTAVQYFGLLVSKLTRDLLSPRLLLFGLVGAVGVVVHLCVLRALLGVGFAGAQLAAALTAMTSNYLINNLVTYRDRRKRGWALAAGYVRFCLLCSVGLAANVAVAAVVHEHIAIWWLAGIAGAAVGAGWNFVTTSVAVW